MPPPTTSPSRGARTRAGARSAAASAAKARLDLRHQAVVRVEELLLYLRPAAEVVDREQLRPHRKAEALVRARQDGPVAALREELLCARRVEELDEGLRRWLVLAVAKRCDRVVDPDRRLRYVEVRLLAVVL